MNRNTLVALVFGMILMSSLNAGAGEFSGFSSEATMSERELIQRADDADKALPFIGDQAERLRRQGEAIDKIFSPREPSPKSEPSSSSGWNGAIGGDKF